MKGIFGQDHLAWKTDQQEGVFSGEGVYDAAADELTYNAAPTATGTSGQQSDEIEYPLPGSVASCDACGEVVDRFYHCQDCQEETGLFDLCSECCAALYLQQGRSVGVQRPEHPTHDYASHRMLQVAPQ